MTIPSNIFREYDIRGIADTDLTSENIILLGKAVGTKLSREGKKTIAIGHDLRPSSERLVGAITEGLTSTGMHVIDLGLIPTPLLYFSVSHFDYDAGISITGSHNPPEYNGFKLHLSDRPYFGAEIQELLNLIQKDDFVVGEGKTSNEEVVEPYTKVVQEQFKFKKKLKVVVDCGHAMACVVAPQLIKSFGHEVIELYTNLDSTFPDHHPDPSELHNMKDLQEKVLETKADIGIAFDGDADRIGVVNEKGEVLLGDRLLLLYSRALLEEEPGSTIIGDVKCSKILYDDISKRGGNAVMWKTGHSLIKAKMKETQAALAGEMSGHIFFAHRWYGFDDAIYAAIRILEILDRKDETVSQMIDDIPELASTPEIRVDCPDDVKFPLVKKAVENFKDKYKVIDIDGARVEFEDGWGLVRASNTQPVLVMRFEANNQKRLDEIQSLIENEIQEIKQSI